MLLEPKLADAAWFVKFLHLNQAACFLMFSKEESRKKRSKHLTGKWTDDMKRRLVTANVEEKMEVGLLINQNDGKGRRAENITHINAFFADFDSGRTTEAQILSLSPKPHAVVQTSPGRFHAYWLIKGCSLDQFTPVMMELAKKLGTDLSVCDRGRIMRLAGTINWKYDPPFLTRILYRQEVPEPISLCKFIRKMALPKSLLAAPKALKCSEMLNGSAPQGEQLSDLISIKEALANIPAHERWIWLSIGMALHSFDSSDRGRRLWDDWSQKSQKFNAADQERTWLTFVKNGGINIGTLFWLAKHANPMGNDAFLDEMQLAALFAATFRNRLRYCSSTRDWYVFNGVIWLPSKEAPLRHAQRFIADLSSGKKGKLPESLRRFRTASGIRGIVAHAELLDELQITSKDFDKNPNLLAVRNGVIDLTTGEFHPANPDQYISRQAAVTFDPKAKAPRWRKFIKSVTCSDEKLYYFIRRALGYSLFGHANQQVFFLLIGAGGNGKGVLMRTIKVLLGDYAQSVPPNLLSSAYSGNANAPSPAMLSLQGARFVICTELQKRRKLDDAFIKQFAGSDEITARANYGDPVTFKPEGKLYLSTNELPEISASDKAMWRRLIPLPFNAIFQDSQRELDLEEKLAEEFPGILNWLLKGAKRFHEVGLGRCSAVENLKAKMQRSSDTVLAWLLETCTRNENSVTQASVAYTSYALFTRQSGRKSHSPSAFRINMKEKGFQHKKTRNHNVYLGIEMQS